MIVFAGRMKNIKLERGQHLFQVSKNGFSKAFIGPNIRLSSLVSTPAILMHGSPRRSIPPYEELYSCYWSWVLSMKLDILWKPGMQNGSKFDISPSGIL